MSNKWDNKKGLGAAGAIALLAAGMVPQRADALIFLATANASFNTTAPTGDLAGSGWELQGRWGSFLGTPVAPSWFLAAKHVGGSVGQVFTLNGVNYVTVARVNHPTADLTLWKVSSTFPSYATLYTSLDEVGKPLMVYGRSAARGAEVNVEKATPTALRGWRWGGAGMGTVRWGQNVVQGAATLGGAQYLIASFDRLGGPNEATLATGDSSGGVFIREGTAWKLAGINYAAQADFALTATGTAFKAAIFDAGGLFAGATVGQRTPVRDGAVDVPASWLATRVSAYATWIRSTTGLSGSSAGTSSVKTANQPRGQ